LVWEDISVAGWRLGSRMADRLRVPRPGSPRPGLAVAMIAVGVLLLVIATILAIVAL
jgi:hypothetical protein